MNVGRARELLYHTTQGYLVSFRTLLKCASQSSTRKFACDQAVVALMRARTMGNSPTAVFNDVWELHSEEWMRRTIMYLDDCKRHKKTQSDMNLPARSYENVPTLKSPPTQKWFLATYVRDVWSRLLILKSSATSIYGSILKIDSTKNYKKTARQMRQLRVLVYQCRQRTG